MAPRVAALDHRVLTVADPERAIALYEGALGMLADRFRAADGTEWLAKVPL